MSGSANLCNLLSLKPKNTMHVSRAAWSPQSKPVSNWLIGPHPNNLVTPLLHGNPACDDQEMSNPCNATGSAVAANCLKDAKSPLTTSTDGPNLIGMMVSRSRLTASPNVSISELGTEAIAEAWTFHARNWASFDPSTRTLSRKAKKLSSGSSKRKPKRLLKGPYHPWDEPDISDIYLTRYVRVYRYLVFTHMGYWYWYIYWSISGNGWVFMVN